MPRFPTPALCSGSALAASACSRHYIPNTDVEDNDFNRNVIEFCEDYRHAVERRNVGMLVKFANEKYYEDGGTIDTSDDLDYAGLKEYLEGKFRDVKAVRYEVRYRDVTRGRDDEIFVDYTYSASTQIPTEGVILATPGRRQPSELKPEGETSGSSRDDGPLAEASSELRERAGTLRRSADREAGARGTVGTRTRHRAGAAGLERRASERAPPVRPSARGARPRGPHHVADHLQSFHVVVAVERRLPAAKIRASETTLQMGSSASRRAALNTACGESTASSAVGRLLDQRAEEASTTARARPGSTGASSNSTPSALAAARPLRERHVQLDVGSGGRRGSVGSRPRSRTRAGAATAAPVRSAIIAALVAASRPHPRLRSGGRSPGRRFA